jgi:hypothetical protein
MLTFRQRHEQQCSLGDAGEQQAHDRNTLWVGSVESINGRGGVLPVLGVRSRTTSRNMLSWHCAELAVCCCLVVDVACSPSGLYMGHSSRENRLCQGSKVCVLQQSKSKCLYWIIQHMWC